MFALHKWPKGKSKYCKGGRPKKKNDVFQRASNLSHLELLHKLSILDDEEYGAARLYEKIWHLYTLAIETPRVRLSIYGEKGRRSRSWDEDDLIYIEERWEKVQKIIKDCGRETKKNLEEVICYNRECTNLKGFKIALREMSKRM